MNQTELNTWLEGYRRAWESRNPDSAAALFSEDVQYYETPFLPAALGRDGVREYWANATRNQSDVNFSYDVVAVVGDRGIARWHATFTRVSSGVTATLDGIFLLEFNHEGLCRELREWWHKSEPAPRPGGGD